MQDKKDFSLSDIAQGLVDSVQLAYERGLQEAWEAARRIERDPAKGGLTMEQFKEVFGRYIPTADVFMFDVHEVLEKLKAWDERDTITVGDEVEDDAGTKSVVMAIDNNQASLLNCPYKHVQLMPLDKLHKTGRHIDEVEGLLEKLKKELTK